MREVITMFEKKYSPSIKNNNNLRDKVVSEVGSFIYRLEHGRFDSEADKDAVIRIIEDLKSDVETLSNTVGTGDENIEALANSILALLKELKKSSEQDMLHRIQEVADELDFNINLIKICTEGFFIMRVNAVTLCKHTDCAVNCTCIHVQKSKSCGNRLCYA